MSSGADLSRNTPQFLRRSTPFVIPAARVSGLTNQKHPTQGRTQGRSLQSEELAKNAGEGQEFHKKSAVSVFSRIDFGARYPVVRLFWGKLFWRKGITMRTTHAFLWVFLFLAGPIEIRIPNLNVMPCRSNRRTFLIPWHRMA
jgi:hypothetical protein